MATTWTSQGSRSVSAACTTGTEAAPTLATEGMLLDGVNEVTICYDTAVATTAGGLLKCYWYNDLAAKWCGMPDLDQVLAGLAGQSFQLVNIPHRGRLALVPSGAGQAGTLWMAAVTESSGRKNSV